MLRLVKIDEYFKHHIFMKGLVDDLVITCDKFIDDSGTVSINSIKKKKMQYIKCIIIFFAVFISNHIVIDNPYYLLLLHRLKY